MGFSSLLNSSLDPSCLSDLCLLMYTARLGGVGKKWIILHVRFFPHAKYSSKHPFNQFRAYRANANSGEQRLLGIYV